MRWIIPSLVATTMALAGLQGKEAEPAGRKALEDYVATLAGERAEAGRFLLEHLPAADSENLTLGLFRENLDQAFTARDKYPWTKALDRELFFNEVLPHAVVNETRDPWRKQLRELFDPLLTDSKNVRDAATVVGSRIAELTGVKYDTKREKACQSPAESMRQHMASCTGLSILMVDALRACGVPARLAGIPMWGSLEGNHTWVEIHDGTDWHLSGYGGTPDGWDKGWEIERCAYCDPEKPFHGVFATSYRKTAVDFPMIWDWKSNDTSGAPLKSENVCLQERDGAGRLIKLNWKLQATPIPGVDRTARYIELAGGRKTVIPKGMASVPIRAYLIDGKTRVDVAVRASRDSSRIFEGRTASEAQDLNDFVRITCPPGTLKIEYRKANGEWTATEVRAAADTETPVKLEISPLDAAGVLSIDQRRSLGTWFRSGGAAWPTNVKWPELKDAATTRTVQEELWSIYREAKRLDPASKELGPLPKSLKEIAAAAPDGKAMLTPGSLTLGKHRMPFIALRKEPNPVPQNGRAMFICLHGGGGNGEVPGPHAWDVNTQEWQAQCSMAIGAYSGEGVFFIPRMADDRLGRWWHAHVQDAVDLAVGNGLREWGVDPDRVYLMGISEGCYGTQILGPFMADRFGGANAMAGGVGDDVPAENLRNLAFRTDVGEKDLMFDRVGLARKFHARMDASAKTYGGYPNHLGVQAGKGHGIDYRPGSPWMLQHHRNPRPDTVVWTAKHLDHQRRPGFYWLGLSGKNLTEDDIKLTGKIDRAQNRIDLTALAADGSPLRDAEVSVMLDDAMVDFSRPVTITCNGKSVSSMVHKRSVEALARTLTLRGDPGMMFPVRVGIGL
jgi:hypothetical protein